MCLFSYSSQVRKFDLSSCKLTEDDVVIMASDGLWERLSSEKVMKLALYFFCQRKSDLLRKFKWLCFQKRVIKTVIYVPLIHQLCAKSSLSKLLCIFILFIYSTESSHIDFYSYHFFFSVVHWYIPSFTSSSTLHSLHSILDLTTNSSPILFPTLVHTSLKASPFLSKVIPHFKFLHTLHPVHPLFRSSLLLTPVSSALSTLLLISYPT